jgi:hypothetical protein
LAGRFGRLQRLHLGLARLHAEEGHARALRDAAARGVEVLARLLFQQQGFLDAVAASGRRCTAAG